MTEEINFKELCNLTTKVMGLPQGSLSLKSRKRQLQASRSITGYIGLTEENIPRSIVAKVLNRDRAVTYHYETKHKKNFKHCIIYRKAFEKIYTAYKNIDNSKKVFLDNDFLKSHLLQNGVSEKLKFNLILEVKSGKAKCNIKTSYFDFSNQIENIKLAMQNYHYFINIL
tara:strand:+ start:395 stop:904 length:510 start_codon:yes stop_codon:yes gene_type:complete